MRDTNETDAVPIRKVREQAQPGRSKPPAVQASPPPAPAAPVVVPARDEEAELAIKARNVVRTSVTTLAGKFKREPAVIAQLLIELLAEYTADGGSGPGVAP
jgi:hypothetical protein